MFTLDVKMSYRRKPRRFLLQHERHAYEWRRSLLALHLIEENEREIR